MNYQDELEKYDIETFGPMGEDNVKVLCPFHGDSNPSGEVHLSRGTFYCFSCHESASFTMYLSKTLDISYEEALAMTTEAERAESVLEDIEEIIFEEYDEEPFRYYSRKWFFEKFRPVLGTPGELYLRHRCIQRNSMQLFDVRWGETDEWEDRVIIPVYDWNGRLVTWVGRTVHGGVSPKTRKPRSGLMTLFGLNVLLAGSRRRHFPNLIIQEGEIDAMWTQQCGHRAVSTMGTSRLTARQVALLSRYADNAIFCYDNDPAGRYATGKGIQQLSEILPAYSVRLPVGKDPNDLTVDELNDCMKKIRDYKKSGLRSCPQSAIL